MRWNFSTKIVGIAVIMLLLSQVAFGQFHWVRPPENPVLPSSQSGWDSRYAWAPSVIFRDGVYHLWYSGWSGSGGSDIGYATSLDGIHWDRCPSNPVINGSVMPWTGGTVRVPAVTLIIDRYVMIFGTHNAGGWQSHSYFGIAASVDGVSWNVWLDPILSAGPAGSWDETSLSQTSSIVEWGGRYWIWYSGYGSMGWGIGAAYSDDLITWEKSESNPVFLPSTPGQWDGYSVEFPEVFTKNHRLEMWYAGQVSFGNRLCIGIAHSSDGITWERSDWNPVFEPSQGSGWDSYRIISPAPIIMGDQVKMWYSAVGHSSPWNNWNIGVVIARIEPDEYIAQKSEPLPTSANLRIQGPNPFNASTGLEFTLTNNSEVSLRIYNSLAQLVDILESGILPAGSYTRIWDATQYASGVYFAELTVGSHRLVERLILIK